MIALAWPRIVAAAALLVLLSVLYLVLPPVGYSIVVAIALLAAIGVQFATFWFFGRRSVEHPEIVTLSIRAKDAVTLLIASIVVGLMILVILARVLDVIPPSDLSRAAFAVGLAFGLLMLAGPAVNWLWIWHPWRAE